MVCLSKCVTHSLILIYLVRFAENESIIANTDLLLISTATAYFLLYLKHLVSVMLLALLLFCHAFTSFILNSFSCIIKSTYISEFRYKKFINA